MHHRWPNAAHEALWTSVSTGGAAGGECLPKFKMSVDPPHPRCAARTPHSRCLRWEVDGVKRASVEPWLFKVPLKKRAVHTLPALRSPPLFPHLHAA